MITDDFTILDAARFDVCVVGSGPVGSCLAADLYRKGFSVLVLESGLAKPNREAQSLSDAVITWPDAHHPMESAVSRSFGGTSRLWGGRCVPLDEIDFEKREYIQESGWPIRFEDVARYETRAAELLGCDDGNFQSEHWPGGHDASLDFTRLERWVNVRNIVQALPELRKGTNITVLVNATVTGFDIEANAQVIKGVRVARRGHEEKIFRGAAYYILALGGIETARLLLNIQCEHPLLFGGNSGTLGRYYMGHVTGSMATIRFYSQETANKFENIKGPRSFSRRRIQFTPSAQREFAIPNIAFWPDNEDYNDPRHGIGIFSAISLILNTPGLGSKFVAEAIRRSHTERFSGPWFHVRNIIRDFRGTVVGLNEVLRQFVTYNRSLPRLFIPNPSGVFRLHFHAEQVPDAENRIRLSTERDLLSVRRAIVDFRFSDGELARIEKAHQNLDRCLRSVGLGEVSLIEAKKSDGCDRDGLHQIGLTRMAETASNGVVDTNCKIFEFENVFVAGSSVFPTSGQANPTLPAVALAMRLSDRLASQLRAKLEASEIARAQTSPSTTDRKRLNILFVTASYYPAVRYGGPIYSVHGLARALVARGHRVVVYTTDVDGDERIEIPAGGMRVMQGVEVHYFHSEIDKIYWSRDMIRALRTHVSEFDIVHAHAAFVFSSSAARRAAVRAGIPFVFSPRGMLIKDLMKRKSFVAKSLWCAALERANCGAASFIHATSGLEREEISKLNLPFRKFEVIPNGVDLNQDEVAVPGISTGDEQSQQLSPYVLSLGRVSWKKGLDRLIPALALFPELNLVIAGNDDEDYTPELQALARKHGMQNRVFFVGPAYGKTKIAWMKGAKAFVLPSYSESFGIVAVEAMACGCPVVLTPEVGIAEIIRDSGAGLIAGRTPEEIAKAIYALTSDPEKCRRMGEFGRRAATELFSWDAIAATMEAAYRHRCPI